MSWEAVTWASKVRTGSPASKAVLLALANFADEDGYCYPSQKKLSEITECSERSVRRYLDAMEKAGLIRRETRRRGDGSYSTDGYYLLINQPAANLADGQFDRRSTDAVTSGQALAGHEPSIDTQNITTNTRARAKPTFNWQTGKIDNLPDALVEKWQEAYPAVNVHAEIAKAEAWQMANPARRKVDLVRFLNNWLARSQDRPAAPARRLSVHTNFGDKTYAGTPDDEIPWLDA